MVCGMSRCALVAAAVTLGVGIGAGGWPGSASGQELPDALFADGRPPGELDLPPQNPAGWALESLGVFYCAVFSGLAASLVALLVFNLLGLRRNQFMPSELVAQLQDRFRQRRFREGSQLAAADASPLGRTVAAGLAALPLGYDQALEVVEQTEHEQTMAAEHRLGYLALIGTIAPMLGLMGTVQGMIASFSEIAHAQTPPPPWVLARGISTALFTTLVGLFLAIPAIAAFNLLRNRIARLRLELGQLSEELLRRAAMRAQ